MFTVLQKGMIRCYSELYTLHISFDIRKITMDKTLEIELSSTLKQCDITTRNVDCTDSIISYNIDGQSESLDREGWNTGSRRIKFPVSKCMDNPTSPLLNPNAIHERRSLDMLKVQEDCSSNIPQNGRYTPSFRKRSRALPIVRVPSPSFARHNRQKKEKTKNNLHSIRRPPRSPSSRLSA